MNTKMWAVSARVRVDDSDDCKQHVYNNLKQHVGNSLFDVLSQVRNPAVVEISDLIIKPAWDEFYGGGYWDDVSIEVKVTPVKYQDVTIQREHSVSWNHSYGFWEILGMALNELKWEIKRYWRGK